MKIKAPCRLGKQFHCEKPFLIPKAVLAGLSFFYWESQMFPGTTLCGKRDPFNEREHTCFFHPEDAVEGIQIEFEVPDQMFMPGFPLRELGLETATVGYLQAVHLLKDGWEYYIHYGKDYGGPLERVRTPELDKLFDPVLPLHAVQVDLKEFLI